MRTVVNWFQIVFLREDSQVKRDLVIVTTRCELISNCIFTWGFTSCLLSIKAWKLLWIDFKLYFYVRIHKFWSLYQRSRIVVNWFQIVFLREDSQDGARRVQRKACCELISNCIFTWGFTSTSAIADTVDVLWIDFKLYFYVRIHKC